MELKFVNSIKYFDQIFIKDLQTGKRKKLWSDVSVSGVSTLWECTLRNKELQERWGDKTIIESHLSKLIATANLSNLHVTPIQSKMGEDEVKIYFRASQGANFNRDIANIDDLLNMGKNIEKFFLGSWKLKIVGTCTRKTGPENVPKKIGPFLIHFSGLGYSASGADYTQTASSVV